MDLYIFRHAETYYSKMHLPYGKDVETADILPEGVPPIRRLAKYLKDKETDANFTSPYLRCVKTSAIVTEVTEKKFTIDERLHDWNQAIETTEQMAKRIEDLWIFLNQKGFKGVLVCTHGYPISVLTSLAQTGKFDLSNLDNFPNTGTLVEIVNGDYKLLDFNESLA